jgi:tetratricopeptide (TPR) repeat protein
VAGRTSSSQFKGKTQDFRDIGKKLNVATILEGSVGRQGNRTKVTTRLVKASDGFLIWSATYDKEMGDIFAVQEEIGRAVSGALKIPLLTGKVSTPSAKSTNNEAYTAYLQGRYFLSKSSAESRAKAVSYFGQATRLDSVYAPAWVGLGESLIKQVGSGEAPGPEGYRKAREAVERALMLDPNLGDAHEAMGDIKLLVDWDWSGAKASYQRALALKPGSASVLGGIGSLARILGQLDEAARLYSRVIEIEPLSGHYNLGLILHYAGRQEEARAACTKSLELDPERAAARVLLARVYLAQGRQQEALREAEKVNHPGWRPFGLALAYHALGRKKESDLKLAELIQFPGGASFLVAEVYAYRGESDQAFVWLERAYTERDTGIEEMKADPLLASLRSDPRYRALLKKMRLPV